MAMVTSGGKILIHSPFNSTNEANDMGPKSLSIAAGLAQERSNESNQVKFLNTNKDIVALESGQLDEGTPNELLFIGSQTNLLAYNVEQNSDVFDCEVPDGLNCLTFGKMRGIKEPLIVAGGDCSITGFDVNAEEKFWTVTGDNARTMKFMPWTMVDDKNELVVGSDDFAIRVFKGAEMIFDINEEAKIVDIQLIKQNVYGYALANGTYGVYYSRKRLWKQKQSAKVTSLAGMDFTVDGQSCIAIGFDNGTIEVRKHRSGDLLCKVDLAQQSTGKDNPVVKVFYCDYRMQGSKQIVAVGQDGLI